MSLPASSTNKLQTSFGAAEKTVKVDRGRVMAKMGVTSVAGLVRLAQSAGVAPRMTRSSPSAASSASRC